MNSKIILTALALVSVAAGGYWFGAHKMSPTNVAVNTTQPERKVLYYRNPMGLPDTSPIPKKDAMGMDYVAVYEGDEKSTGVVSISSDKVQKLGVKSEAATLRMLDKSLRASGRIEIDERRTFTIAPKFEGWVERLYVNTTGQTVSKGQPLFEVYSPELVSGLHEQALAKQGLAALADADEEAQAGMRRLAQASSTRLRNWDIEDARMQGNRVTYHSPVTGVVLEKKAIQGMRFTPGEVLYQIADLSSVWVIADMPEQQIAAVKVGGTAQISVDAYPDKTFVGHVDFIYPTLNSATRTVPVRIILANANGALKPAMYARVELPTDNGDKVLTVPNSAVIDSGTRQVALVQLAAGRFEPRIVKLGGRGENYVEVLSGIAEGEQVVTSANFLIDAESNLKAALDGLGATKTMLEKPSAESSVQPEKQVDRFDRLGAGHQARGILNAINADGTVSITHQEIKSLSWPSMTMDFALANSSLARDIPPGSAITFELVKRKPGEWIITKLQVLAHEEH